MWCSFHHIQQDLIIKLEGAITMGLNRIQTMAAGLLSLLLVSTPVFAGDDTYAVTITNVTAGQSFTPLLAITHTKGHPLFMLGSPASAELTRIAEGGDTMPFKQGLMDSGMAYDSASSGGLLGPGQSVTLYVKSDGKFKFLTVAGMLLPTNDGVIALNGMMLPKKSKSMMVPSYDGGTEINDELCASIPGPHCGGAPFSDEDGEGFVHIHSGIHGVGDLRASERDWRNPVARITVTRMDD
jgi:hypothetical protein